ncbi:hypothetical protein [Bradyrhizobium elkanii]|uniref:hypothetical protein n=1 Tax=Bradyrhizobium elkanii TaxID=29448 RepID=UPI003D204BD1
MEAASLPIEKQVCSLDLAKRLKELGVKQESYFLWKQLFSDTPDKWHVSIREVNGRVLQKKCIAAFTVAEIGEMLGLGRWVTFKTSRGWEWQYTGNGPLPINNDGKAADTEADARAKMLIYLLENNLIAPSATSAA